MYKIDEKGQYLPFPGSSVIASAQDSDNALWGLIHECMASNESISSYYSPLPSDSYHVTFINLFTKAMRSNSMWLEFVESKLPDLRALKQDIDTKSDIPIMSFQGTSRFGNTIRLSFTLPQEQRELIKAIADKFGYHNQVPKEFHMTLAYQYRNFDQDFNQSQLNVLISQLNDLMECHGTVRLKKPSLYYFEDMQSFNIWDASNFPFTFKQNPGEQTISSDIKDTTQDAKNRLAGVFLQCLGISSKPTSQRSLENT